MMSGIDHPLRRTRLSTTGSLLLVLLTLLLCLPVQAANSLPESTEPLRQQLCTEVTEELRSLRQENARNNRELKREIAALHHALNRPGPRDILAGIGYILGLFGAAAFVAARRRTSSPSDRS